MKWIIANIATTLLFGMLDFLRFGWAAPNLYRPIIGEIVADQLRVGAVSSVAPWIILKLKR